MTTLRYPDESAEYRRARDELLAVEIELRTRVEAVAAQRRRLPLGGRVHEDYAFDALGDDGRLRRVRLSDPFVGASRFTGRPAPRDRSESWAVPHPQVCLRASMGRRSRRRSLSGRDTP